MAWPCRPGAVGKGWWWRSGAVAARGDRMIQPRRAPLVALDLPDPCVCVSLARRRGRGVRLLPSSLCPSHPMGLVPSGDIWDRINLQLILGGMRSAWGAWTGFNFSAEFRRNFGFFSFPLVTGIRNFGIFRYISFQNSINFVQNPPKSTEISERNFVSAKHRDFIGKRNG